MRVAVASMVAAEASMVVGVEDPTAAVVAVMVAAVTGNSCMKKDGCQLVADSRFFVWLEEIIRRPEGQRGTDRQ
jgi:hypothetical protein